MNINHMLSLALTGLLATTASAEDAKPGDILEGINMFTPGDGAPAYKVKANDRYGTQWAADVAYGFWAAHNQPLGVLNRANFALLHAQVNQRIAKDDSNGGTWLRVEFSGSWGLDRKSANKANDIFDTGATVCAHADVFGAHTGVFPEVALMHYFAGKRACLIAGMVNLTNYFDAVGIANDSFSNFVNNGFVNSTILPLVDSNAGAVFQYEFNSHNYAMFAVSRTGATSGYNPFTSGPSGYCIVGEFGHIFGEDTTLRITPFYRRLDAEECDDGRLHHNIGAVASVEHNVNDRVTVFARAGAGGNSYAGNTAEISFGGTAKLIPSRENDFLGFACGVFKGPHAVQDAACNHHETVLEAMYNFQVTDNLKIVPHVQFIHNAAGAPGHGDELLGGVQAVFSF